MGSQTFSTYWDETGLKRVTVTFDTSSSVETSPQNFEIVVTGRAATAEVRVMNPPITVEIDTPTSTIWNISNAPSMPYVMFHATVNRDSLWKVNFRWRLVIHYPPFSPYYIPLSGGEALIKGADIWSPSWGGIITGGTMSVSVTAVDTMDGTQASAESYGYQIKGTNPTQAQIFGIANNIEQRAVCWQESTHRQFNAIRYTGIGVPLSSYANDGGYGLMMPTPANNEQVWSWSGNLRWGVIYLGRVRQDAQTYLNTWYSAALNTPESTDDWDWNPADPIYADRVWDDAFARYGPGGHTTYSPNGNRGVRNCSGNIYSNPTGCSYANTIRQHIINQPWR
jgi:hypothetical protein